MQSYAVIVLCFLVCCIFSHPLSEMKLPLPAFENSLGPFLDESNRKLEGRSGRKLFKKIKTGAAFAAGVKLGSYLAGKGLGLGTGSISSANSFQLFGKSISSAFSLSYGGVPLPGVLHDPVDNSSLVVRMQDNEPTVLHIAVIGLEPATPDFVEQLKKVAHISEAGVKNSPKEIKFSNSSDVKEKQFNKFLQEHTHRVNELNGKMFANKTRTNNRF